MREKGKLMTLEIEKINNGYLITCDDERWIASDINDVRDIVEEILEKLEETEDY